MQLPLGMLVHRPVHLLFSGVFSCEMHYQPCPGSMIRTPYAALHQKNLHLPDGKNAAPQDVQHIR